MVQFKQLVKTLDKVRIHAIIKSLKQVNNRWIAACEPLLLANSDTECKDH